MDGHRNGLALEEFQKPGIEGPGRNRVLGDLEVKDIILDPRVMREIAEEYGISRSLVARIKNRTASYFQERGVCRGDWEPDASLATLPVVAAPSGHPTKLDDEDVAKILQDGRTLSEIARELGVSVSTVWRVRARQYQGQSKDFRRPDVIIAVVDGKPIYA